MTREKVNALLCIILETVAEVGEMGAPEGPMYAAMMGKVTLEEYAAIRDMAVQVGLVTRSNHQLFITPKGNDTVAKIAKHRAEQGAVG